MTTTIMHVTAPREGPTVLGLLAWLFEREPELALLHNADSRGWAVLGVRPQKIIAPPSGSLDGFDAALRDPGMALPPEAAHLPVGWIGTISYEAGAAIELGAAIAGQSPWPAIEWIWYETYFLFDHANERWTTVSSTDNRPLLPDKSACDAALASLPSIPPPAHVMAPSPAAYRNAVARAIDYIAAGDIYQVNLAQHWGVQTAVHPVALYAALCAASPAAYAAFIARPNRYALSASPELFLARTGRTVLTRPIKGTRPRDPRDPLRSAAARDELLASAKDRAELAMIVDLLRNDLGRVAAPGTVRVTTPRAIEMLPTLWHTHAEITATLAHESTEAVLRATLPGGSITGAPKIRAMQIIRELEAGPRGLYCGNIGLIRPNGDATLNIAIRTIQLIDGIATLHAGAGIVADSTPEDELAETLAKAAALLKAIAIVPA